MSAATSWRGAAARHLGQRVHIVELAVVDAQRRPVLLEDIAKGRMPADRRGRVFAAGLEHLTGGLVRTAQAQNEDRLPVVESLRGLVPEWAGIVYHVHDVPAEREDGMLRAYQRQIDDAADPVTFQSDVVTQHAQLRRCVLNDVLTLVGCAEHQSELAVDGAHYGVSSE